MTSWFDSSSTLSDQVEEEKHDAQYMYQPVRTHQPLIRLWDRIHGGWPYQPLDGGSGTESSVGRHDIEAYFREHFLSCGETVHDFDRCPMVEYNDLIKIPARKLPKQAQHIFGVLSGFCKLHWRDILCRTFRGAVGPVVDSRYIVLQLPCDDDSFNWLWGLMGSIQNEGAGPQLLAAPVIPGVIEVVADKKILPANFRKPDVLPHGILSRQAAFHCKDRAPYREVISGTLSNPNRIIKDMVESFTLTPCAWSVVDHKITYHPRS